MAERVVIAGPGLLRAANATLLRGAGFAVVAEAADPDGLLRKVRGHRPDAAILDTRGSGLARDELAGAVRAIRADFPDVGVLLLGGEVDDALARALTVGGAEGTGYLLERRVCDVERYLRAIREVAAGGTVLEPEVVTRLVTGDRRDQVLARLGERDREVLAQLAAGATNRGIARRMFLSERAIERHVTAIFAALGIRPSRHHHRRVLAALAYLRAGATS